MLNGLVGFALIAVAIYTGLGKIARAHRMFARLGLGVKLEAKKNRGQRVATGPGRLKSRAQKRG